GPCPGEGIVVAADDITVDLNGHTISGDPAARMSSDEIGVQLRRVSGVTLRDGTVEGFDSGVAIMGGSGNVVQKITARDNVNYRIVTGRNSQPEDITPDVGPYCDFGDGITLFNSDHNRLENNVVTGNGPFAGISLVFDSDDNVVTNNKILDNDVLNETPAGEGTTCGSTANGPIDDPPPYCCDAHGRHSQSVGARIEGPGAERNLVKKNHMRRNGLAGVLVSGYHVEFGSNNGYNVIRDNDIADTGLRVHDSQGDGTEAYRSSGIQLHHSGPGFIHVSYGNLIEGNKSSRNFASGIEITGPEPGSSVVGQHGNAIRDNVVNDNVLDGIHLAEGTVQTAVTGNRGHRNGLDSDLVAEISDSDIYANYDGVDGGDYSPGCASNEWSHNRFGTVNQGCVALDGTGWIGGPGHIGSAQRGGTHGQQLNRGRPYKN
ncbi:MAG: right-handed parallel beta-helix repeat-containing protein, partial [Candidatus Limnocylindrales bacterium]